MNSEFSVAVHILAYLAYVPGHMACSEDIASNVCTNPARIRKIMGLLRKEGFVRTKEGTGGGYMLSLPPEEIRLARVYGAVACRGLKPKQTTGDTSHACLVASNMQHVMNGIFAEAEHAYLHCLDQSTIRDVLLQALAAAHTAGGGKLTFCGEAYAAHTAGPSADSSAAPESASPYRMEESP